MVRCSISGASVLAFARPSQITDDPDYICGQHAPYFVVAIDPLGEIPWKSGKPDGRPGLEDARIIVITSSQASKEYLNLLREKGIAYLISRGNEFHLTEPMEKLKSIFGIERISLQGGGLVNGTFANEKLIDKLSLVVIPFVDSSSSVPTTFETGSFSSIRFLRSNSNSRKCRRLNRKAYGFSIKENS